ncbi:methyltransferase domain-containing protein [Nanoarchaeota archaeon]
MDNFPNCKVCKTGKLKRFLELGDIPPVNAFISEEELPNEKAYPLNLAYCESCLLVQIEDIVPPEKLFSNYLHLSSGSASNIKHLREVADNLNSHFSITQDTKILEIGSNDGTLLSFLKEKTDQVLGVDPAKNLVDMNKEKGVDYIPEFFNTSTAAKILEDKGHYDLIVALNVIPHTPDVVDLLQGVERILSPNGTLVMEGAYALETILKGEFDTIYHEHVYSFSLHSLISTFKQANLKVVGVEKIPTQGGSLRIYAQKMEGSSSVSEAVTNLLKEESEQGLTNPQIYDSVDPKVKEFKKELRKLIDQEKQKGSKLIGLGGPARGVVILNYCGIGIEDIAYLVDDTPLKQGKLTPGVHVPVKSFDSLKTEQNPIFFLLSWNYKDHFITKLKEIFPEFTMIVPFPKLELVKNG